jgi:hypothetical protein
MNLNAPTAAPRATPAAAAPAAPSATPAPAATIPITNVMEHFSALAKADLLKGEPAPAAPAATPEPPVATPPAAPAPANPAATPDPNAPPAPAAPAVPDPAAPVQTTGPDDAEDLEPTAEEQATWTDGEKRLYGALKKERQARKEAKAESKQTRESMDALKQELDGIKEKLNPNPENNPQPASNSQPVGALGDCHTFESVDARVTQAATTEAFAMRLQTTLSKQGAAPVVEALKQKGITQIGGVPVAELGDEGLSEFLTTVYEGARITQTQADPRKRFLVNQASAWQEAVKQVPELADAKSDRAKRFVQMANENPAIRSMGPNWPLVLAYQVLGREAAAAKGAPAPVAAPAIKPTPTPTPATTRQVPAAPRATPPTPPKKNDYEQAAEKLANGTATLADITRMAKAAIVSKGG